MNNNNNKNSQHLNATTEIGMDCQRKFISRFFNSPGQGKQKKNKNTANNIICYGWP